MRVSSSIVEFVTNIQGQKKVTKMFNYASIIARSLEVGNLFWKRFKKTQAFR